MTSRKMLVLAALLAGVLVVASGVATLAEDDDDHEGQQATAKRVIETLKKVKVTLAAACTTAEQAVKGKAVQAKLEIEENELSYEVVVAVVDGEKLVFHEVDVDAVTGKVKETEVVGQQGDDDDDDEGDDEEDEDDDD